MYVLTPCLADLLSEPPDLLSGPQDFLVRPPGPHYSKTILYNDTVMLYILYQGCVKAKVPNDGFVVRTTSLKEPLIWAVEYFVL